MAVLWTHHLFSQTKDSMLHGISLFAKHIKKQCKFMLLNIVEKPNILNTDRKVLFGGKTIRELILPFCNAYVASQ